LVGGILQKCICPFRDRLRHAVVRMRLLRPFLIMITPGSSFTSSRTVFRPMANISARSLI
jgi:hypothetical protein